MNMDRREFLGSAAAAGVLSFAGKSILAMGGNQKVTAGEIDAVPGYLEDYSELYRCDPRLAALKWFKNAKFGLFMHYGIYSELKKGEWVQFREQIPVAEYKKLKDKFTAENFDADFITDLACRAEMKYVNITAKHHDGFCLFDTKTNNYNSVYSPAGRDLIGELAHQCHKKKLGLFLYYSYAADWQHPYYLPRKYNKFAQPDYEKPQPGYKWKKDEDFKKYLQDANTHVRELLTNYGPIAGIWFDPLLGYYGRPDLFPMNETYAMIRTMRQNTLISFKQGVTGTEDFAAPERKGHSLEDRIKKRYGDLSGEIAKMAWEGNRQKYNEICDTLQKKNWGYNEESEHKGPDEVMQMLKAAADQKSNLLLNTGPLPDGSIHPEDVKTLKEVGKRIRKEGLPA